MDPRGAVGREARARQREALIVVGSAKLFRPEQFAELTTPSAALRWLRNFLLMPQPPLLFKEEKSSVANLYAPIRRDRSRDCRNHVKTEENRFPRRLFPHP